MVISVRVPLTIALLLSAPALANAADVTLAWDANVETDIAGYKLHYGIQSGIYTSVVAAGTTLTHVVTGLTGGQRYYFVVQAYNTSGAHSPFSAEVSELAPLPLNHAPVVMNPGPQSGTEGQTVALLAIGATDADAGDNLIFSATGLPSGLTLHPGTGVVSGTVGFDALATNPVVVTVTDGNGGSGSAAFSWTIALVNRPPVLTNPGPQSGTEGVAVTSLHISATDADGHTLTYSATGRPSGITISATTGVMNGTVGFDAQATNTVIVTVTDGNGGTASTTFNWTITLVNRAPVVTNPGPQSGSKGQAVTPPLAVAASDPDAADTLTYSATGLPSGLAINTGTGAISGTVAFDALAANSVQVTVTDGNGGTASATFSWTITLANHAPVVMNPGPQSGTEGQTVALLAIGATDADAGDNLIFGATGLPSGLTLHPGTGVVSGTVGFDALATNPVVVTVTDGNGGSGSAAFIWTIALVNRPPVLTNPGPQSGTEGVAVTSLHISATDADGHTLTYSATGRPSGITISATTGVMSGTVGFNAKATNTVKVTVTDGNGGTASTTFSWTITLVNRKPVVTNPGPQSGSEGQAVTPPLAVAASDPDAADTLTYSATGLPSGLAINTGTGAISGTVAFDALAANPVQVAVTDGNGGATTASFSWTIAKRPPIVVSVAPAANATNASSASFVTATFNEPLDPSSVGAATFELRTADTNALVTAAVSYDAAAKVARLSPSAPLVPGGSFTASIKGGPAGVRDFGGDALATDTSWSFTVAAAAPAPGSGLVAAYGFDEGAGTATADWSGRGHTGTLSGAAWQAGKFGKSLAFDGVNDWVTVAASGALDVTTSMTIEAWVYPTEAGGWRTIVFKEAPEEVWRHAYGLYSSFGAEGPGGHVLLADNVNLHAPAALSLNVWSHLATTYDGGMLRLFVNGMERAAVAATGSIEVSAGDLRIGGNAMWGDFFKGRIDEVRLYNRALATAEIQNDMSTPVGDGPVAAYSFDEGTGLTARDDTGLLQTGTIAGATWTAAGRFGSALQFDGVDDWVTVADSSWLDLTREMTLEAWVYPTAAGGWRSVLTKQAGNWYTFALYSDGSTGPNARIMTLSDANATTPTALALDAWSHLAATYDGSTLRLFVNGAAVASLPVTGALQISSDPLRIGGNSSWGEHFAGVIDEVRVYNRALTVAEIQTDMSTSISGGPVAAYGFDDGAGSTARDDAGHGLTGTVSGATWSPSGRFGGALHFDGVDDWVTVTDSNWLDLANEMTLEAWVYPTAPAGWRTVLMKQSALWYTFALYADGSVGPNARVMVDSDANATSPVALPINVWSHLAATYDGATLRLFVNGLDAASMPLTGVMSTSSDPLRIGGNSEWGEYFAGLIDEVRIYNRALDAGEIQADMTTPVH